MSNPLVSVIMNCLNCARELPDALESLRAQTLQDFEIIFWDNGSTDQSADIAKAYGSQLKYFHSEPTVPLGAARNLAIAEARGTHIAFLDCDDLWRPTKLQKQVATMGANPRCGLVCTDTEIFDGKRVLARLFSQTSPASGMVYGELLQRQWISMSSAMIRRAALQSILPPDNPCLWFDERLNVCEEADLFYRIAHDWEVECINEPLTVWRVHGDNTTFRKFGQFAEETLLILDKHQKLYPEFYSRRPELAEALTRRAAFQKAVALWRDGHNSEARKTISPWLGASPKFRLFWGASFLPGSCFDVAAKLYFALPAKLRLK